MTGATATTPRSVHVSLRGHALGSIGAPTSVMVEVRGPDRRLVDRRMLEVNASPVRMRLSRPGPHAVRATLGSGSVLYEDVDYDGVTTPPPVQFLLYDQSPHESLQRTAIVHRLGDARVGHLTSPPLPVSLDTGVAARQNRVEPLRTPARPRGLQLGQRCGPPHSGLGAAPVSSAGGGSRPGPAADRPPGDGRHRGGRPAHRRAGQAPLEVAVTPASAEAATLLGYFGGGAVTAVDAMIANNPLLDRLVKGRDLYDTPRSHPPSPTSLAERVLRQQGQ
jgi:hypothetical protein